MLAAQHGPTESEMLAHRRRMAFRADIAAKADRLAERLKAAPPALVKVVEPDAAPPIQPAKYAFKETWFQIVSVSANKALSLRQIKEVTCDHFGLQMGDMVTARRTGDLVRPRQIAMYLCKELTPKSLPEIGRHFGGRDHTTILHAGRKVAQLIAADPKFAATVTKIRSDLEALL